MNEVLRASAFAGDMAREALVELSRSRPERRARPDGEPLRVLFTIDTEISMGGAARNPDLKPVGADRRIWAETKEGRYGISYFMDVFDEHNMKGVFFFEPVARSVVSENELKEAAQHIVDRGHALELHVHPEFEMDLPSVQKKTSKSPNALLFNHDENGQRRYIRESAGTLEKWTGVRPCAFRAGGYSASETTLRALRAEGIEIDSSSNHWAVIAGLCGMTSTFPINDVAMLEGSLEVPVTNLKTKGPKAGLRPLELSSLNTAEMIAALEQMYEAGVRVACAVTHSFRLVRAFDHQYTKVEVDAFNVHRLRALCRYLARAGDRFRVCTFRDLPLERWKKDLSATPEPFYPSPPVWSSALRMVVQAVKDRGAV